MLTIAFKAEVPGKPARDFEVLRLVERPLVALVGISIKPSSGCPGQVRLDLARGDLPSRMRSKTPSFQ